MKTRKSWREKLADSKDLPRVVEITGKMSTRGFPVCIDDDEITFFFLTRNESLEPSLIHVISDYTEYCSKEGSVVL